jgi:outer membrane lipoprotein-sorting protein
MHAQHKNLISKIIFSVLIFVATEIFAANTAPNASDELAQLLNNIHTMQATFEQSLVNNDGGQIGQNLG